MSFTATGKELKEKFGSHFEVRYTDVHTFPAEHYLFGEVRLYGVVEMPGPSTRNWRRLDRFDTLEEAREEAIRRNAERLQGSIVFCTEMQKKWINRLEMFRLTYGRKKFRFGEFTCRALSFIQLKTDKRKKLQAFLDNFDYLRTFSNSVDTITQKLLKDDQEYTFDSPLLAPGATLYRTCWSWPTTHGVTVAQIPIVDVCFYSKQVWGDPEEEWPDFKVEYSIPTYDNPAEDDDRLSGLSWKNGKWDTRTSSNAVFDNHGAAVACQEAQRARLTATINGG